MTKVSKFAPIGLVTRLVTDTSAPIHYCCPYAWMREVVRTGTPAHREAARLGVSLNTVKKWRKELYAGNLQCGGWRQCQDPPKQEKGK
jgi:hypothetical protein